MRKIFIIAPIFLVLVIVLVVIFLKAKPVATNNIHASLPPQSVKTLTVNVPDEVFKNALNVYAKKKAEKADLSSGPCLGSIGEGWVLDIASNPRTAFDDKEENQCEDFRTGKVQHYLEFDLNGSLIGAR